jgi:hypothetical protein
MAFYLGDAPSVVVLAPAVKLGGGLAKPRPIEGKIWPTGLPKQAT